jgi:hypothetical protein
MKKSLLVLSLALVLSQITKAQVITAVPCDMLGMSVNVGSQETSISIYHSGGYMTHPRPENIFTWEFSDQQGNILHQDTIVDDSFCNFDHNWSLTDTIFVTVTLVNDSANLDNWYISEGLSPNNSSINCLFENQLFWKTDTFASGNPNGYWTFVHDNFGVDMNSISAIEDYYLEESDSKLYDMLGRELKEVPLGIPYIKNRKVYIKH